MEFVAANDFYRHDTSVHADPLAYINNTRFGPPDDHPR